MIWFDRHTGQKIWEFFGKDDDLKQMISAPCLADGKLYFGEGFHDDKNCRVFCVDAATGKKKSCRFAKPAGQTGVEPDDVANGKVYIGAGNVGVYCLDAKSRDAEALELSARPEGYKDRLQFQAFRRRRGPSSAIASTAAPASIAMK